MRVLALLAAFAVPKALAWSCSVYPMTEESARQADHAFVFQLLDATIVSTGNSPVIYEGAHGSVRIVQSIRGEGARFNRITFVTTPYCGTRLDVGHYYVAFVSGSGPWFSVDEGNIANITAEYSEYSEYSDYPRSDEGIITRVSALLDGVLSLDEAIPNQLRSRVSQVPPPPPPPPPCPDTAVVPES